ncbi:hypothetical protein DSO57_1023985 [Entomophthora muscae]|uniref:Uncharacterized protein n=1 Tax=Entomophthora muscae TaxID=34485 RepID=A0ACC2TPY7_9FUNG|nr:hypothetical protein DSO57_1023985 [Entomophthora muscae]
MLNHFPKLFQTSINSLESHIAIKPTIKPLSVSSTVINEISILVLKTWKLKPGSQGKPYVEQSRQETAQLPVGSNPGPPEIDDPKQEEQKPAKRQYWRFEINIGDPGIEPQSSKDYLSCTKWTGTHQLLMSYSETCQSPKDNSPNDPQIAANLVPPKIQNYAEVVACLKEVKTNPTDNSANDCQQLPVFRP